MRNIIGLIVGFYLTVALVVFVCGAWSFSTDARWKACAGGGPDWIGWASYRAIAWPKAYWDEKDKADDIVDWLMIGFDPFGGRC